MALQFRIFDSLIIPYGFNTKWDINKIKVKGVDNKATYFESEVPCFYLNTNNSKPLRIGDINNISPEIIIDFDDPEFQYNKYHNNIDPIKSPILGYLMSKCETTKEREFLKIYFEYFSCAEWGYDSKFLLSALLPIPQAHLYLKDPLKEDEFHFVSDTAHRIDFLFWTGEKVIAIEIDGDGPSHVNPSNGIAHQHIIRDRRFQYAGIQIIHILNSELDGLGWQVLKLLPKEIIS
ncbi:MULTISPECIES: hypothetical protein [unclassified Paenibacillus]|uniref:hypothetical protein n=1 Tax=unclassified Paenibacillus TaxID=185978 RepID=UPI0036285242